MQIKTSDPKTIQLILSKLTLPVSSSHKGQNGRVLIVGGSKLFHAASLWAAEVASYFVDIVHYSSTEENEKIFLSLKKKFINGIVVSRQDLPSYVNEDDAVLVGPGMVRTIQNLKFKIQNFEFNNIIKLQNEGEYTYQLVKYLIGNFPEKKFVFDAGALQMMEKEWLMKMAIPPILTPHQNEFSGLFGIDISGKNIEEKQQIVKDLAKKYRCVILLKTIQDIISDGDRVVAVEGGNPGLTKGGTGDILAGLTASFYAKNQAFESAVMSSYLLKRSADELSETVGYWYNINNIIEKIPVVLKSLFV